MKKIFVILSLLICSISINVYASETNLLEWNTTPSTWAESYVSEAAEINILPSNISGYIYEINRENFCEILYSFLCVNGKYDESTHSNACFYDINKTSINNLAEIGIINGTGDKTFSPEMFLTREQAAVILNRTLKFLNIENKQEPSVNYCDFDQVSEWAKNDVSEIYQFGIMIGNDEGQFNPQSRCTTEEMIVAVMRVYELIK